MIPAYCLAFASLGAILAFSRSGFFHNGMSDARLMCMVAGMLPAAQFHKWRQSPLVRPVVLYGACLIPSLLLTKSWAMSTFGHPGIYSGSVFTFALCAVGLLIAEQLEEGRDLVKKSVLVAGSATVLLCLMQRAHMDPFGLGPLGARATGFQGSPVDVGALMVVLLTFAPRWLMPAYAAALIATVSRGAWLGGLVALMPRNWRPAACLLATFLAISYVYTHQTASDRVRFAIWGMAAKHLSVIGTGPATFNLTFSGKDGVVIEGEGRVNPAHAHNSVLDAFVTRGIIGVIGLAAFFFVPELAGLWTVCMFNPVSFEVTFVACVLAGLERGRKGENLAGDAHAQPALELST